MQKILVIRFSSIGDVVLTSPVVRSLKNKGYEVHYLIKPKFVSVIASSPYIDKIHLFQNVSQSIKELSKEKFDFVVDLQNNYKSRLIRWGLNRPSAGFPKLNIQKFLVVLFKNRNLLPHKHIVDRYFEATKKLHIENDLKGLDFFIDENKVSDAIKNFEKPFVALVAGGSYGTKRIPYLKIKEICIHLSPKKIVLLGDTLDKTLTADIEKECSNAINLCGQLNLYESAYLIKQSEFVISSDTGLMHIAAAFHKKIYSLWGNTIPEFGMYPYMPDPKSKIIQNNHLWCRPCSKLGYQQCPLKHFKCMLSLDIKEIDQY